MSRADEKRAFDAMLAEISDSDEEDFRQASSSARPKSGYGYGNNNNNNNNSNSKSNSNSNSNSMYRADAKGDNYYSSSSSKASSSNNYPNNNSASHSLPPPRRAPAKLSKEEQEIENFGASNAQSAAEAHQEQLGITKRWLTRPCARSERSTMKCFVERERHGFGLQTTYRCFLEGAEGQPARFMMSAKKKAAKQSSYYLISLDEHPSDDRGSETVLGKIRGNSVGSRYIITDGGIDPEKTSAPSMFRKEFCVVGFEFDSGGPSRIDAWVPAVSASGVAAVFQPDSDAHGMEALVDANKLDRIMYLHNKQPKWDETHGGHVLNFQGRVTESSVKNFQLCSPEADDPDEVLLQFGRVGKHKFNMDLRFPLSPLQAFGICVACMDGKIADRKGYEYIKKFTAGVAADANGEESAASSGPAGGAGASAATPSKQRVDGSMKGSSSLTGMLRESLPSGQYLRDKLYRSMT